MIHDVIKFQIILSLQEIDAIWETHHMVKIWHCEFSV